MRLLNSVLRLLALVTILSGCSKSNEATENAGGNTNGNCNSTNMKFATDIVPILQANCYACHSNANVAVSGISLEGYANVKTRVNDGRLLGAITHASGFSPMPQGGSKLSDCNINKIKDWINRGAENN